jgi:chemotaxis signal transduction protein
MQLHAGGQLQNNNGYQFITFSLHTQFSSLKIFKVTITVQTAATCINLEEKIIFME